MVLIHRVEAADEAHALPAEWLERALGEVAPVAHVGVVRLDAGIEPRVVQERGAQQQLAIDALAGVLRQPLGDQELAHAVALHRAVGLAAGGSQRYEGGALGRRLCQLVGSAQASVQRVAVSMNDSFASQASTDSGRRARTGVSGSLT